MKPQGKRAVDLEHLRRLLPLYGDMIDRRRSINTMLKEPLPTDLEELHQETVRRALLALRNLLAPGG